MPEASLITVVDDDKSLRDSLNGLLKSLGHQTAVFSSATDFLGSAEMLRTACLILDVRMPGMSGPELQRELSRLGIRIPIIFLTAHDDGAVNRRVLADGAVDCLLKPFSEESLLQAIHRALGG